MVKIWKRRGFLKSALGAAASAATGCFLPFSIKGAAPRGEGGLFPEDLIQQNTMVQTSELEKSLDAMAISLARKKEAPEAWQTIFRNPNTSWSKVRVAFKFNEVGYNKPRVAIINKIVRELAGLGVPAGNIVIYGGANTGEGTLGTYYKLLKEILPQGVVLGKHDSALGGRATVSIPTARKGAFEIIQTECIRDIGEGRNHILINLAVNTGHWEEYGGFTLTMKNHFGTFNPKPYPSARFEEAHGNFDYLLAISRSQALIGGGIPQQQLCIVDSLWAGSELNPGSRGDGMPYSRLVMGTFSPAVDFLTAFKIRQKVMGCPLGENARKLLPAFGYAESLNDSLDLVYLDEAVPNLSDPVSAPASNAAISQINPAIDNLRVVCCKNEKILARPG